MRGRSDTFDRSKKDLDEPHDAPPSNLSFLGDEKTAANEEVNELLRDFEESQAMQSQSVFMTGTDHHDSEGSFLNPKQFKTCFFLTNFFVL